MNHSSPEASPTDSVIVRYEALLVGRQGNPTQIAHATKSLCMKHKESLLQTAVFLHNSTLGDCFVSRNDVCAWAVFLWFVIAFRRHGFSLN